MALMPAWRGRLRLSLHAKMVVLIVLICAILLSLDGWRSWQDRVAQVAETSVSTANLARSLAQHAHDTFEALDTAVVGLRQAAEMDGLTPRSVRNLHELMVTQAADLPMTAGLYVFSADGAYLVDSRSATPRALNAADRPYFQYHRSHPDRGPRIGNPVRSKVDGSWIVTVSRRINAADGSFAGVAVGNVSVDALQRFYATFDVGRQGAIALETTGGILVARKPAEGIPIGADLSKGPIQRQMLLSPVGSFQFRSAVDGVERLGSYQSVEEFPLVIVVADGLDEALTTWRTNAVFNLAISLGVAVLIGWLGSRLARGLRRQRRAEETVRRSEQHYRLLADNSTDLIVQLGPDFKRLYVSPASKAMLGYDPRELVGRSASDLLLAEDAAAFSASLAKAAQGGEAPPARYRTRRKDGSEIWVETTGRWMEEGHGFVVTTRDVTLRKAAEDQLHEANGKLQRLVLLDGLTGISNRRGFDLALGREHGRATREDTELALLLIDVDCFKAFNDTNGHQAGDACLQAIATCLSGQMQRPADLSARYGGEEFAMLLPGTGLDGALLLAERVLEAVRALGIARHAEAAEVVTVSVGAAVIRPRRDERSLDELVRLSDAALYQAKDTGRNRVCWKNAEPDAKGPTTRASGSFVS